jgi:hypothetical protein
MLKYDAYIWKLMNEPNKNTDMSFGGNVLQKWLTILMFEKVCF